MPPALCPAIWPAVEGLVARAFRKVGGQMPDYRDDFASARRLLWVAATPRASIFAAAVTRLEPRADGLRCIVEAAGGSDLPRWPAALSRIEQYARAEGAAEMFIEGRSGWRRVLPDYAACDGGLIKRLNG